MSTRGDSIDDSNAKMYKNVIALGSQQGLYSLISKNQAHRGDMMKSDSLILVLAVVSVVAVVSLVLFEGGQASGGFVTMINKRISQPTTGCDYSCGDSSHVRIVCEHSERSIVCDHGCDPGAGHCK